MRLASLALIAALCLLTGCPHPTPTPKPPTPTGYFCNSTDPKTYYDPQHPYRILQGGPTSSGSFQYSGQILTHTPNDNEKFCPIRQTYFEIPQALESPIIQTILIHHGGKMVEWPISYDTVDAGPNGGPELYRTDAQSADEMTGDYDLLITVTGRLKTK